MIEEKNVWERLSRRGRRVVAAVVSCAIALFMLWWINEVPAGTGAKPGAAAGAGQNLLPGNPLDTRPILVLDAGHGGQDPGAVSADGSVLEAAVTSELVGLVQALLAPHGDELVVVRAGEPDVYATPLERANVASALQADLLVSLHLNADTSPDTRGFQVYPTPPGRVHHAESLRFGELLVERMKETNVKILGENGVFYAYYIDTAGGAYNKVLVEAGQITDPWDDDSFGVVEYPGCPAALVELWYISSAEDMALFNNEAGKAVMATAVYRTVCDYFDLTPKA
ncbi:N-acetylmuramoyl-L-alanine amidase [Ruminococcaceae bacterium OttesenSCG-928-D13]|nr:N-acetylmuramoyl-L-alanine amidase [Ruminococcaceae bacterium OttesenSCG-928-D13]